MSFIKLNQTKSTSNLATNVKGILQNFQLPATNTITPITLTFATTLATNAALGSNFRVTLTNNFTLSAPTNAVDGQKIMWELIQDSSGSRVMTLGTGFALGTSITSTTLTTTGNKRDFMGAYYNATTNLFYVIAFVQGF